MWMLMEGFSLFLKVSPSIQLKMKIPACVSVALGRYIYITPNGKARLIYTMSFYDNIQENPLVKIREVLHIRFLNVLFCFVFLSFYFRAIVDGDDDVAGGVVNVSFAFCLLC